MLRRCAQRAGFANIVSLLSRYVPPDGKVQGLIQVAATAGSMTFPPAVAIMAQRGMLGVRWMHSYARFAASPTLTLAGHWSRLSCGLLLRAPPSTLCWCCPCWRWDAVRQPHALLMPLETEGRVDVCIRYCCLNSCPCAPSTLWSCGCGRASYTMWRGASRDRPLPCVAQGSTLACVSASVQV